MSINPPATVPDTTTVRLTGQTQSGIRPMAPSVDQITISPRAAAAAAEDELSRQAAALHQEGLSTGEIAERLKKTEWHVKSALVTTRAVV